MQNLASNFVEFVDSQKSISGPYVMNPWLNFCYINLQQFHISLQEELLFSYQSKKWDAP